MASELRVNQITSITGVGTVTFNSGGVSFAGSPNLGNAAITSINSGPISGYRNRIINGAMEVDQRYNGGSVTVNGATNAASYNIDRFQVCSALNVYSTVAGIATFGRQPGPRELGFPHCSRTTVTTAGSGGSNRDILQCKQTIESGNIFDFSYGTLSAKPSVLSFYVRSSLVGQRSLFIYNPFGGRVFIPSYNINSPNTWERKSIVIPGDSTGFLDPNPVNEGFRIEWRTSCSGSVLGNATSDWKALDSQRAVTGDVDFFGTAGATFDITGVQLELGTTMTTFERRSYGQELSLCQRYFEQIDYSLRFCGPNAFATSFSILNFPFKKTKRSTSYTVYVSSSPGATWSSRTNTFVFYSPTPGGDNTAAPASTSKYLNNLTMTGSPTNGTTGGAGTIWIEDEI